VTSIFDAPWTTWLFVRTKPSGVNTKPEPLPVTSCGLRTRPWRRFALVTWI